MIGSTRRDVAVPVQTQRRVDRAAVRIVVVGSIVAVLAVKFIRGTSFIDLDVYLLAGRAFARGGGLYQPGFGNSLAHPLPYMYPPFLAALMVLVSWAPQRLAGLVWMGANLLFLTWVVGVSYRAFLQRFDPGLVVGVALLVGLFAFTIPVGDVVNLGQVDLVLIVLVLADTLPERTRLPRGVLVGIATAIKLTPAAFIAYWVLVRRWRPAVTAACTAVTLWSITALIRPDLSRQYWTSVIFDAGRIGDLRDPSNQSLNGVLHRAGISDPLVWGMLATLAMVAALLFARSAHNRHAELLAVTLVGLGTLLASPVSWTHHGVWIIPASGVLLGELAGRRRVALWVLLIAAFLFRLPIMGRSAAAASGAAHALGSIMENSYVLIFIGLLVWLPTRGYRSRKSQEVAAD